MPIPIRKELAEIFDLITRMQMTGPLVRRKTVRKWVEELHASAVAINKMNTTPGPRHNLHPCHDQYCYDDTPHPCHKEGCTG